MEARSTDKRPRRTKAKRKPKGFVKLGERLKENEKPLVFGYDSNERPQFEAYTGDTDGATWSGVVKESDLPGFRDDLVKLGEVIDGKTDQTLVIAPEQLDRLMETGRQRATRGPLDNGWDILDGKGVVVSKDVVVEQVLGPKPKYAVGKGQWEAMNAPLTEQIGMIEAMGSQARVDEAIGIVGDGVGELKGSHVNIAAARAEVKEVEPKIGGAIEAVKRIDKLPRELKFDGKDRKTGIEGVDGKVAKIKELKKAVKDAETRQHDVQTLIDGKETERKALSGRKKALEGEIGKLKASIRTLSAPDAVKQSVKATKAKANDVDDALMALMAATSAAGASVTASRQDGAIAEKKAELAGKQKELAQVEEELAAVKKKAGEHVAQKQAIVKTLEPVNGKIDELKGEARAELETARTQPVQEKDELLGRLKGAYETIATEVGKVRDLVAEGVEGLVGHYEGLARRATELVVEAVQSQETTVQDDETA